MRLHTRIETRNAGGAGAGGNAGNAGNEIANLSALAEQLRGAFDEHAESIEEALETRDVRLTGMAAQISAIEQRLHARPQGGGGGASFETVGALFTRLPAFETFRTGGLRQGMVFSGSVETRAVTALALGPAQHTGTASKPLRRPRIRDLLPIVPTQAPSIEFVRMILTPAAESVSEGTLKPEAVWSGTLVNAPVRTLAHWSAASRQVLDDVPGLSASIDNDLMVGLEQEEEQQILTGDGTGVEVHGIVPQATAYTNIPGVTGDLDTVAGALKQLSDIGVEADGIVLHSSDWLRLQTMKGSDGHYYAAGGPFGVQPQGPVLWGCPVVATPALPLGHFLVGGFAVGATLHIREEINVVLSTEDRDNFIRNMVTILAEERVALAVRKPQAFVYGFLPAGTT